MHPVAVAPPILESRALSVGYGRGAVVRGLDLAVGPGETVALLGPSGSGKTTLLYALAGFLDPIAGEIRLRGRIVATPERSEPPERRRIALVFQHAALWPHLTALETAAYPLRRAGLPAAEARRVAGELLERLGIGQLADRRPAELSGGEQQRVGLARALARRPDVYLFDEPTSHLDRPLRAALTEELVRQRRTDDAAAVYATHDVEEALALADRVVLIRDGELVQAGTPADVYERPVDEWAARLTGPASVVDATFVDAALVDASFEGVPGGTGARLLVRPDWVRFGGTMPATVESVQFRGTHTDYRLVTPAGRVDVRRPGRPSLEPGAETTWAVERAWPLRSAASPAATDARSAEPGSPAGR